MRETLTALDEELLNISTAAPQNVIEEAHELFEEHVELLTIEGAKAEIEDASVRAMLEILNSDKVSPRDKLSGINTATELIGKKGGSGINIVSAENMQINQLSGPTAKHLLGAGSALKTITGTVEDVN